MNDTVKLIIEIPRNEYEYTCERTFSDRTFWDDAIRKGVSLDSVRAEIEKKCDRINSISSVLRYPQHREIQDLLCGILASIDGESEGE